MSSRLLAWGRVCRLSLLPSAAADVAAGTVVAAGFWPSGSAPWTLILASLCVYHGGMALNDWADREVDAGARSGRPIPSRTLSAPAVLAVALLLLSAGPWIASFAGPTPALVVGGVAVLAAAYDLGPRGPWLGPFLLGACRAGNFGAGLALGLDARAGSEAPAALALALLYGLYVFQVSRLGRLEDLVPAADLGRAPARILRWAAAALPLGPIAVLLAGWSGPWPFALAALAVGLYAAFPLWRAAARTSTWTPPDVLPVMGLALRRLLLFSGACALARGGLAGGLVFAGILAGYPISWALRRPFPPS